MLGELLLQGGSFAKLPNTHLHDTHNNNNNSNRHNWRLRGDFWLCVGVGKGLCLDDCCGGHNLTQQHTSALLQIRLTGILPTFPCPCSPPSPLPSPPTQHNNTPQVAQLAGYVSEHSAYHHGEASLQSTIIGLAQDFVGSNNLNLLYPSGQFGTRLQGGKDAASARQDCFWGDRGVAWVVVVVGGEARVVTWVVVWGGGLGEGVYRW